MHVILAADAGECAIQEISEKVSIHCAVDAKQPRTHHTLKQAHERLLRSCCLRLLHAADQGPAYSTAHSR